MAMAEIVDSSLRLTFYDGEDPETGDSIYKMKSFNNVKPDADAEQLYTIAQELAQLQEHTLYEITRQDSSDIREEE